MAASDSYKGIASTLLGDLWREVIVHIAALEGSQATYTDPANYDAMHANLVSARDALNAAILANNADNG
jgi:hypothetical protein